MTNDVGAPLERRVRPQRAEAKGKMMMMEYQVAVSGDAAKLAGTVRDLIGQGWKPQGGIAVSGWHESVENGRKGYTEHSTEVLFAQAMVRMPNELGGY